MESACERQIEIVFLCFAYQYSYFLVRSCCSVFFAPIRYLFTLLCARGNINTPKSFSCELRLLLEFRRVGWHCCS